MKYFLRATWREGRKLTPPTYPIQMWVYDEKKDLMISKWNTEMHILSEVVYMMDHDIWKWDVITEADAMLELI